MIWAILVHDRSWVAATIGFILFALTGCGGGTGSLSGKVTMNGKPVTSGTVQAFLVDGATLTSEISPDGNYSINELPAGITRIGVSSPNPKKRYEELLGFAKTEEQRKAIQPPDPALVKSWVGIPDQYAQPESSGLTVTIKSGPNQQDFVLTGSTPPPTGGSTGAPPPPGRAAKK